MALPDRLPEPPEGFENHSAVGREAHPDDRPDWLVGAEEGAQSEIGRDGDVEGNTPARLGRVLPMPDLHRPAPPQVSSAAPQRIGVPLESRATPAPAAPPKPTAWTGVGNSVPRLTQAPQGEIRTSFTPKNQEDDVAPIPDDDTGVLAVSLSSGPTPTVAPPIANRKLLEEPWWVVIGERIAGDRRIVIGAGIALLVGIAAFVFWPRPNASISIHTIRKDPELWEGRSVRVSGRVGDDVFPLGSGYVFPLLQGRDTIVVFTRSRTPERKQRVTVIGEVSAGYLDGRARLAILETPTP